MSVDQNHSVVTAAGATTTLPLLDTRRWGRLGSAHGRHRGERPAPFGAYRELSRMMVLVFVRDKGAIFFMIIFPVMFLGLFGTLFRGTSTRHATIAQVGAVQVLDTVQGDRKTALTQVLNITRTSDETGALRKVRAGDLDGVLQQQPDGTLHLRYSTADPTRAATLKSILDALLQQANLDATHQRPAYRMTAAAVENVSLRPIQYLTPGLLGWAIASGAVFSASLTLVNLRRRQVLRRMRLAPVSAAALVLSRTVVTTAIALVQTTLFLAVATLPFFGLKLTGSWWLIVPLVLCATVAFMAVGMLVGSISKSEEAANGLSQLLVMPMSFLSGSFFSLDGAPGWVQLVAKAMPLRYLVVSSEAVLTRGGGLTDALPTIAGLLLFAAALSFVTLRFFSWDD